MDKILEKLEHISGQVAEVKTNTAVQSAEIGHINEKLGRGQKFFDHSREQFSDINSHLAKINGSMVNKGQCDGRHNELKDILKQHRKWLALIGFIILGGGSAAVNSDKLVALLKTFLGG